MAVQVAQVQLVHLVVVAVVQEMQELVMRQALVPEELHREQIQPQMAVEEVLVLTVLLLIIQQVTRQIAWLETQLPEVVEVVLQGMELQVPVQEVWLK
jgi:hypothetical protein